MISCAHSDIKTHEEEKTPVLVVMVTPALSTNQEVNWGSLFGSGGSAVSLHNLWMEDHFFGSRPSAVSVHRLWVEDHFLAVEALARFNLSISRRSEAEHLERTAPISDSFLRSIAASAAPSRSLTGGEEEELPEWSGLTCLMMSQVLSLTWWPGELWPSAQALPWKRTSWLRTCCYSSCKLQQMPEEEAKLRIMGTWVLTLSKITKLTTIKLYLKLQVKKANEGRASSYQVANRRLLALWELL